MALRHPETAEMLAIEKEIADHFCGAFGATARKLGLEYRVDFAVYREGKTIRAFLEVKRRTFVWGQYPSAMMSFRKFIKGRELAKAFNLPFLFLVSDANGALYLCDLAKLEIGDFTLEIGGRTDRNDSQDIEPVAMIPIGKFKPVRLKGRRAA
jgi:hypothetical protein